MAASLIQAAGGRPHEVKQAVELALEQAAEGPGRQRAGLSRARNGARLFDLAQELAKKAGDSFVTAERLLQALAMSTGHADGDGAEECRRHAAGAEHRDQRSAQGPHRRFGDGRERV